MSKQGKGPKPSPSVEKQGSIVSRLATLLKPSNNSPGSLDGKPSFWHRNSTKVPGTVKHVSADDADVDIPDEKVVRASLHEFKSSETKGSSSVPSAYSSTSPTAVAPLGSPQSSPVLTIVPTVLTDDGALDDADFLRAESYLKIAYNTLPIAVKGCKFLRLLCEPTVDLDALKELTWSGVPESEWCLRATVWQLLLGYLPANRDRRIATLRRKRQEYIDCLPQHAKPDGERSEHEQDILKQIKVDIPRTSSTLPVILADPIQLRMERLLYVWALRHPASGYVQGINDLVTPFFIVFLSSYIGEPVDESFDLTRVPMDILNAMEADSYWCLSKVLDGITDHYTHSQPGIQRMVTRLKDVVRRMDSPLHEHLEREHVQYLHFAFRWMNCLLIRELSLPLIIRTWDTYISEGDGFAVLHVYVCAAFLIRWSSQLREMEFQDLLLFIQSLPTGSWTERDVESMLSQAFVWKSFFHSAPQHLK